MVDILCGCSYLINIIEVLFQNLSYYFLSLLSLLLQGQAFINRELVNQGFAVWRESPKTTPIGQATPTLTPTTPKSDIATTTTTNGVSPPVEGVASLPVLELFSMKKETGASNNVSFGHSSNEQQLQQEDEKGLTEPLLHLLTAKPSAPPPPPLMVSH